MLTELSGYLGKYSVLVRQFHAKGAARVLFDDRSFYLYAFFFHIPLALVSIDVTPRPMGTQSTEAPFNQDVNFVPEVIRLFDCGSVHGNLPSWGITAAESVSQRSSRSGKISLGQPSERLDEVAELFLLGFEVGRRPVARSGFAGNPLIHGHARRFESGYLSRIVG